MQQYQPKGMEKSKWSHDACIRPRSADACSGGDLVESEIAVEEGCVTAGKSTFVRKRKRLDTSREGDKVTSATDISKGGNDAEREKAMRPRVDVEGEQAVAEWNAVHSTRNGGDIDSVKTVRTFGHDVPVGSEIESSDLAIRTDISRTETPLRET